jgi:hypothetical protein
VREHGDPGELTVTVEPYAESCGWVRVGVVVLRNKLASRGVVERRKRRRTCESRSIPTFSTFMSVRAVEVGTSAMITKLLMPARIEDPTCRTCKPAHHG